MASQQITAEQIGKHIAVLASDAFEGRKPGTAGEDATVNYIAGQFKAMGLAPGSQQGSYFQTVQLMGIRGETRVSLKVRGQELRMLGGDSTLHIREKLVPDSHEIAGVTGPKSVDSVFSKSVGNDAIPKRKCHLKSMRSGVREVIEREEISVTAATAVPMTRIVDRDRR